MRIVVGFPPGQSADITARVLGQWLGERFGQPFVVDNRPGASNSVATDFVVHAPPDGYTLLWIATSNYINATLDPSLPYNFIRDIEPVASNARSPLVMEVNPADPGRHRRQSSSLMPKPIPASSIWRRAAIGNSTHMAGELFKMLAGSIWFTFPIAARRRR